MTLNEARSRVRVERRATVLCVLASVCVAFVAMATCLHGWRSGWPPAAILWIVVPAAMALSVLSLVFDRILADRLRAEIALMDATLEAVLWKAGPSHRASFGERRTATRSSIRDG